MQDDRIERTGLSMLNSVQPDFLTRCLEGDKHEKRIYVKENSGKEDEQTL
jgi:hypothetical protein